MLGGNSKMIKEKYIPLLVAIKVNDEVNENI